MYILKSFFFSPVLALNRTQTTVCPKVQKHLHFMYQRKRSPRFLLWLLEPTVNNHEWTSYNFNLFKAAP